jgi:ABC-type nitrate/sulfonate/bicarbonate transport system ATPase subunit
MVSWPDCWFANQLIVRAGSLSTDSPVSVISGHSGVGKTTLLRGICKHNSSLHPRLVFQEPTLLPWLSVAENLRIVCEDGLLHAKWLELFDLPDVSALRPGQLSLGMQRRIAIIRGILAKPGLLLLDEPSASLDHENVERLIVNIQVASAESRVPIVVVTHNPADFAGLHTAYFELRGKPAELQKVGT